MLENSFYTNNNVDKQVFNASGSTWQTWSKPEGRSMAYIVCIGGGGAGGAGFGASSGNRGGGAGGGSSAITIAQVPFYSIPDTLYVQVSLGGVGGVGTAGGNGGISYVSCYPTTDMFNCLVLANAGGGGGAGTSAAGGVAGTAGVALSTSSTTNPRYLSLCNWASYAGRVGAPGVLIGFGSDTIANTSILTSGASGGGAPAGSSANGGVLNSADTLTSFLRTINGGTTSTGTVNGGNGIDGYSYLKPFLFVGGSGGASGGTTGGNGGNGGNANIGCGGGGGGVGVVGGNGGNGGNGLVMIISY